MSRMRNRSRAGLAALLLVASCSDDGSSSSSVPADTKPTTTAAATTTTEAVPGYSAEITRTEYGIPHIVADDWGSLGLGQGYAYSQDRAGTLLDQTINSLLYTSPSTRDRTRPRMPAAA